MLNLSNIKRVGFIANFNPKRGYPEFAYKSNIPAVAPVVITPVKVSKPISEDKLAAKKALKEAKQSSKWLNGSNPVVLVSTRLN